MGSVEILRVRIVGLIMLRLLLLLQTLWLHKRNLPILKAGMRWDRVGLVGSVEILRVRIVGLVMLRLLLLLQTLWLHGKNLPVLEAGMRGDKVGLMGRIEILRVRIVGFHFDFCSVSVSFELFVGESDK